MPAVREAIGLKSVLDPSTLCKAFERLKSVVWRVLLRLTRDFFELSGVTGIDFSGEERGHASKYYTRRAGLHIKELKVTILVDVRDNVILDAHITTTRKHDVRIAPELVERSADLIDVLVGDKAFDDKGLRIFCRELGIRPLIKHREFRPIQKVWNARISGELYNQRNQCESVRSSISRKYEPYVRSRSGSSNSGKSKQNVLCITWTDSCNLSKVGDDKGGISILESIEQGMSIGLEEFSKSSL